MQKGWNHHENETKKILKNSLLAPGQIPSKARPLRRAAPLSPRVLQGGARREPRPHRPLRLRRLQRRLDQECQRCGPSSKRTFRLINQPSGFSGCVLKPKTTEQVSKVLAFCNEKKLAVCPQGGNTGLVGGSVPVFDEIVLSTALMNEVVSVDDTSGLFLIGLRAVPAFVAFSLRSAGLPVWLRFGNPRRRAGASPADDAAGFGRKRVLSYWWQRFDERWRPSSAQIRKFAGKRARTGSGTGFRRRSSKTRCLRFPQVKANGEVLDCLSTLKKDNTGFHLKHLFIGSEGSLGVVTKVAIQCPPLPKAVNVAFVGNLFSITSKLQLFKLHVFTDSF